MAGVTPDLPVEQISLLLCEGNLDVVLALLLNVNPLEIVFLGSFNEILLSPLTSRQHLKTIMLILFSYLSYFNAMFSLFFL